MSIESKIPTEEVNIKYLSLEKTEPQEGPFEFDPDEYLTGDVHSNIDALINYQLSLKSDKQDKDIPLQLTFDLAIVKPKDFEQMPHNERVFKAMVQNRWDMKKISNDAEMDDFTALGMALTFNYAAASGRAPVLLDSEWESYFNNYKNEIGSLKSTEWNRYFFYASKLYCLKLLNPQLFASTRFTAGDLDNCLPQMLENMRHGQSDPLWERMRMNTLGQVLGYTKLLDPNFKIAGRDFSRLTEHVDGLRRKFKLDTHRKADEWPFPNPLVNYMDACAALKIISAKDIKFTDKGLDFEESHINNLANDKRAPLPEIKKF